MRLARRLLNPAAAESVLSSKSTSGKVGILTLNRPKALNALNSDLVTRLAEGLRRFDADSSVGAIVVTGCGDKAFAAGADIKEMAPLGFSDVLMGELFGPLGVMPSIRKPVIGAINGFALGGGCELAMMCDILVASETAKFGQPEIKIGTIPGLGGTVRLTRAVGKSRAMLMCLTGEPITAQEAERWGLVAKVVPPAELVATAVGIGDAIAALSQPIVRLAKESVNNSMEVGVTQALAFEKRAFQSTFATADRAEGMGAFAARRAPKFTDK